MMINAKELRIGNVFQGGFNEFFEITAIYQTGVDYKHVTGNSKGCCTYPGIMPMPITEEWLMKLGFVKNRHDRWAIGYVRDGDDPEENGKTVLFIDLTSPIGFYWFGLENWAFYTIAVNTIKYVHQLQNLYFALTGTELQLNPSLSGE